MLVLATAEASASVLLSLASIAVLGIGAQWAAWRLRLPSILLLLVCGLLAGPLGFDFLHPDELLGPLLFPAVSLSVAIILFEGGLSLELGELRSSGSVLTRLATIGVAITWVLTTVAGHWLVGLSWRVALLLGAILTVTGPTVIGPLLRHVRPRGASGPLAKWEGIVVDVIGATLAVLVFEAILVEDVFASTAVVFGGLARTLAVAGLFGLLGTLVLLFPLKRHWVPDYLEAPLALAVVVGVFALSHTLQHESGLLAVTIMGFQLANQKQYEVKHIVVFKENLRTLLISSLFILLAARLGPADLRATDFRSLAFVALLILVVRPIAVLASTWRTDLKMSERLFLSWMAPRGIVAAAVSALFALRLEQHGFEDATRLAPLAFLVIMGTVAIYGLTAAPLARRLGLAEADSQGVLIVGASPFARALGKTVANEGLRVLLVDTNRKNVSAARLAGLEAVYGSVLSEHGELDLGGIGRMLAITPNDEVNSLAALHFTELFERGGVYRLVPARGTGTATHQGRLLFAHQAQFGYLEARLAQGAKLKRTPLSEEFDFAAYMEHNGADTLLLFRISEDGKLSVFTANEPASAEPGDVVIALVDKERD